jgi:hypothetical protein
MGFPAPLKSYTVGTEHFATWSLDFDLTKPYGRTFYRLKVTSALAVSHAIASGWTDATNTLVNPCTDTSVTTYLSNVPIQFWGFVTDEYKILSCSQGALQQLLGYFRFADVPAFNENSFPRLFIPSKNDLESVFTTALTPYGSTVLFTSLLQTTMGNADPYLGQRSQASGIFLFGPSNSGIVGRSSDDLAMGACLNMSRGDVFQVPNTSPVEQYILLRPGAGALLLRI